MFPPRATTQRRRALAALAAASSLVVLAPLVLTTQAQATPSSDDTPLGLATEAPLAPRRPGASLLLGQPPEEVGFVLDGPQNPSLPLLTAFRDASIERWGPLRVYTNSRWGRWLGHAWWSYEWEPLLGAGDDAVATEETPQAPPAGPSSFSAPDLFPAPVELGGAPLATRSFLGDRRWIGAAADDRARPLSPIFDTSGPNLASDGFASIFRLPPKDPVRDWRCRRRPVTIIRYGAESDTLELVRCDGSIPAGTQDRLSILARPPEAPRPGDALPDEPDPVAWSTRREWVTDVRLVHPRLLWALQRIVDDFPRRAVYLVSGYRPLARVGGGTMDDELGHGHRSLHADGRAFDLYVQGVAHEEVFKACRALKDVGCGFYPNSKFVHVDVRRAHTGQAFWIDASAPGEPSRYVDSWPGAVESGAMGWLAPEQRVPGP